MEAPSEGLYEAINLEMCMYQEVVDVFGKWVDLEDGWAYKLGARLASNLLPGDFIWVEDLDEESAVVEVES